MDAELKDTLIGWAEEYNDPKYFQEDPIIFPKRFAQMHVAGEASLADVEIAALLSAHLAWGRRAMIVRDCNRMFDEMSFSGKRQGRMEKQLLEDINEVMTALRNRMSFQEERYRYFETLLDTVDTCMLVADKEGQVLWMNRAGVQDLCGYTIHQLEELKGLNTDFPLTFPI